MGILDTDPTLPTNRMVFEIRRDMALYQRFKQNMEPFFEEYGLSEAEIRAWREQDIAQLGALGTHPYFLPQISRIFEGAAYNHNRSPAAELYRKKVVEAAKKAESR